MVTTAEQTWTTVGAEIVDRVGGRETVERKIEGLEWRTREQGSDVAFAPGAAINAAIRDLRIPRVTAFAIDSFEIRDDAGDGFYPGFYGIEGNYTNGRARVYLLDTGVELVPVMSELYH
jgi:hypothetical protein